MSLRDLINADLGSLEPEEGQEITWKGATYPCFASAAAKGEQVGDVYENLTVVVRKQVFNDGNGPFPQKMETFNHNDITYRIDRVLTAPGFLRLTAVYEFRGV